MYHCSRIHQRQAWALKLTDLWDNPTSYCLARFTQPHQLVKAIRKKSKTNKKCLGYVIHHKERGYTGFDEISNFHLITYFRVRHMPRL